MTNKGIIASSSMPLNIHNEYIKITEIEHFLEYLGIITKIIKNTDDEQTAKTEYGFTVSSKKQKDDTFIITIK